MSPASRSSAPSVESQANTLLDNRCDRQENALDFVYRIDPELAAQITIRGIKTTGTPPSASSFFCDAAGAELTFIPLFLASGLRRYISIEEESFGPDWNGFKTGSAVARFGDSWQITAANADAILFNASGADGTAHHRGGTIVIPGGRDGEDIGIRPGGANIGYNPFFPEGTIEVTIVANSTFAGDTLTAQLAGLDATGTPFGSATQTATLSKAFKAYRFYFAGHPDDYESVGLNVEVRHRDWRYRFYCELAAGPAGDLAGPNPRGCLFALVRRHWRHAHQGWNAFLRH